MLEYYSESVTLAEYDSLRILTKYIRKRNIYNLICVHTPLSSKLSNLSSTDHRSWTWYGTTSHKDDSESVTLGEYNRVKIFMVKHIKQTFIIWFVCIHL